MRQWDDWEQRTQLQDTSFWGRILVGLCCGLLVPWLLQIWNTRRAEAPIEYGVDVPERLRSGQAYEVNENRQTRDEVRIGRFLETFGI